MPVDHPDVILISSDDEDDERNLDEESENDRVIIDLDTESDKDEENKAIEEECIDNNCGERSNQSDPSDQGVNDLQEQNLYECKTYLRKHGMRVSESKEECIQRMKEHERLVIRLKDGRGASFYPRSSFTIDCTGDACRGDIVLFKQDVYNCQQNIIGRRTIAGRILTESYGASSKHTFSVEVLWSRRSKKLKPLSILQVKGCNLYRYGTYRQPWNNEAERSEVLREKHERGQAARLKRKLRKTKFASADNKGAKRRKVSSSQSKHTSQIDKHNDVNMNTTAHNQAVLFQNTELTESSLQLTYHPGPNSSMNSDHDQQEASLSFSCDRTLLPNKLLPVSYAYNSHYNNGQQGPIQAFYQPPDHHHQNSEPTVDRLKDGRGESFYPRSSFTIDCTGDACRGDVVLFEQDIYNFQQNIHERRTIAGRILTESYGASSKHTFSVEVLWSKWSKKLEPLSILQVKGCNLYRYGTYRQPWNSEAERSEVLREKHERGQTARPKRKLRETKFASAYNKGAKRRKVSSSQSKHTSQIDKHNDVNMNTTAHNQAVLFQNTELTESSLQLTYHPDPNSSMNSNHDQQEASLSFSCDRTLLPNKLLPVSSAYNCHYNNGQQGPVQAFYQPPDHHHQNSEPTVDRLTDRAYKLRFPKSSFSIKCTGDARKGDVVLFKQPIYLGGRKMQKKKTVVGSVAGKIVKVRKCGSRDKHKFWIKVLWITPSINRCRRSILQVRSRVLYKFGTFRQPRKHEARRSKMFEQKHAPAPTLKWKLKKVSFASNKNKGKKREKVSHNGPSSSEQPTQKAKHKFSKRKSASATNGPSSSKQPTQKAKGKFSKRKVASATPVKETKTGHKRKAVQFKKRKQKKSKQTFHLDPNPDSNLNLCVSTNLNPILNTTSNLNQNLDTWSNPNPSTHTCTNLNLNTHTNVNSNPNVNPHPRSWLYRDHQLQRPSLTFLHDRIFMPNHAPIGSSSDQPPVWFQPSQPPFGLPGYGQWGLNHGFIQPPGYYDHNLLLLQMLAAPWYQQPQ